MLHTEENNGTRTRGSQKRNVRFLETGFVDQTDFIAFGIQQTDNDLPCNHRFPFQGHVVKVSLF
jgi:hypothetical protein